MALEGYSGACELVVTEKTKEAFDQGVEKIRSTMLAHGFQKEAVDSLQFKLSEHLLTISNEEGRSGAFHVYADGTPFYALTVTAPGSMRDMAAASGLQSVTQMSVKLQALMLAFEMGVNLFSKMDTVLEGYYAQKKGCAYGGASFGLGDCVMETTFRCDPAVYMEALDNMVGLRLDMIAPKMPPSVPKNNGPRL